MAEIRAIAAGLLNWHDVSLSAAVPDGTKAVVLTSTGPRHAERFLGGWFERIDGGLLQVVGVTKFAIGGAYGLKVTDGARSPKP